jgi:DNA replication protein DnaC
MSTRESPAPVADFVAVLAAQLGVDMASIPAESPEEIATRRQARAARMIAEQVAAARLAAYESDIGPTYRTTQWDNPNLAPYAPQIARIRGWQLSPRGILAAGPSGRGKTRAIADLYRRLAIDERVTVRYAKAADWFARLNEQVRYGTDDARRWVRDQANAPVFIMDDIGQQAMLSARADWSEGWFMQFLDIRRELALPLIASTNLRSAEIAGTNDRNAIRQDAILTRLLDICEVVDFAR